jgi:hypothetical protein
MKFYLLSFTFLFALIGCWDDAEPEIHNDKKPASEKSESQITTPTETPDNLGNQASPNWEAEDEETTSEKEALKSDEKEAEQTGSRSEDDEEAQYLLELDQQAERFEEPAQ